MTDEKALSRRERRKLVRERGQKWGKDSLSHSKSTEEVFRDYEAERAKRAEKQAAFDALPPEEKERIRRRKQEALNACKQMYVLTCPESRGWRR